MGLGCVVRVAGRARAAPPRQRTHTPQTHTHKNTHTHSGSAGHIDIASSPNKSSRAALQARERREERRVGHVLAEVADEDVVVLRGVLALVRGEGPVDAHLLAEQLLGLRGWAAGKGGRREGGLCVSRLIVWVGARACVRQLLRPPRLRRRRSPSLLFLPLPLPPLVHPPRSPRPAPLQRRRTFRYCSATTAQRRSRKRTKP